MKRLLINALAPFVLIIKIHTRYRAAVFSNFKKRKEDELWLVEMVI